MRDRTGAGSRSPTFADRAAAGRQLLEFLQGHAAVAFDLVVAVPRGGVPVAAPIAEGLKIPLDILVARKVGMPGQRELAVGAVTRLGVVWNDDVLLQAGLIPAQLDTDRAAALAEVERRENAYRQGRAAAPVADRRVLIVDDGIATGATLAAAVQALQRAGAAAVGVAAPVASASAVARLEALGAEVFVAAVPTDFMAVGQFYKEFTQTSDEECVEILARLAPE